MALYQTKNKMELIDPYDYKLILDNVPDEHKEEATERLFLLIDSVARTVFTASKGTDGPLSNTPMADTEKAAEFAVNHYKQFIPH